MAIPDDVFERIKRVQQAVKAVCDREGFDYTLVTEPKGHRTGALIVTNDVDQDDQSKIIRKVVGMLERVVQQIGNGHVALCRRYYGHESVASADKHERADQAALARHRIKYALMAVRRFEGAVACGENIKSAERLSQLVDEIRAEVRILSDCYETEAWKEATDP
jgi:hypothetical protein